MITKRKNLIKCHVTLAGTKAVTYISQVIVQLSFLKINSLLSATSILYCSPMAYNTTDSLDNLACTDYVDFGKSQVRFGRFSWSKNDSNYLDIKLKLLKRENKNAEFRLRQNFLMGEADFNQLIRQTNQLVVAADRQLSQRTKFLTSSSIYTIHRRGGATEACSQSDWRCGLSKQKDFCDIAEIQDGQPRNFLCSSSFIRTEERGSKISANCVCQLQTWWIIKSSWRHDFSVW